MAPTTRLVASLVGLSVMLVAVTSVAADLPQSSTPDAF